VGFCTGKNKSPDRVGGVCAAFFGESMVFMPDIPIFPFLWNMLPDETLVEICR
jgi:hypothetical protein